MEQVHESDTQTIILCRTCCNPLEPKVGGVKFRHASAIDNHYPGTLSPAQYFWCGHCQVAYMSPEQCDRDVTREQARQGKLVFVLAPLEVPSKSVRIVDWLT